jgi:phytoene dehydrogenase-like protein
MSPSQETDTRSSVGGLSRTAVVIGSGPNGLAAAITMARAGWDVTVHEAEETIGGGLRSSELTFSGFVHDVCSAIHPLGRDSPFFRGVELPVEWIEPPAPAAHPLDDGTAVMTEQSVEATAAQLGNDREAYLKAFGRVVTRWREYEPVVLGPYPPRVGRAARALPLARRGLSSASSLADRFRTERAHALVAGHAAHSMLPLEQRPTGGVGLFLIAVAHTYGWPFPRGGSQRLADAMAERLRQLGGEIRAQSPVDELPRADAVLADVVPGELLRIAGDRLSSRYARGLRRYRHGPGVFKLDWALDGPIPWTAEGCRRAATVHLGGTFDEIAASEREPWAGRHAERPYVLLTQPSLFDDSRAPAGRHTAWAYCHVPSGSEEDMTERVEAQVERFAPGFRALILARKATGPTDLERRNRNLVGGDINGGALELGQLFFRPVRRVIPYRTPVRGLYLCSSSTPPGGGVHGMCGYSAALVALRDLGSR